MTKYITCVDHFTGYEKDFTYLENKGKDKYEAIARAVAIGFKQEKAFCVLVEKKVSKDKYLPIYRIYPDGSMEDLVKNDWGGWGKHYSYVTDDMIEA